MQDYLHMKTFSLSCVFLFFGGLLFSPACLSNELGKPSVDRTYTETGYSINDYKQNIKRIEIESGPYSRDLEAPLVSLGMLSGENGMYSEAADMFSRALRVHRANNGLYGLKQIPILELVIDNNIKRSDWKATDKNYHLLDWIYRRNYEKTDIRMLAVIDKLSAWHLAAANLDTGNHPGQHFVKLLELNGTAVTIVDNQSDRDSLSLAKRLYKLALVHYYTAIAVQRGEHIGIDLVQEFAPFESRESYDKASEKIVRKSYRESRKLVSRITSLYENDPAATPENRAIAGLYLADWELLFNRRANAKHLYHQVYSGLIENGFSPDRVNSFFLQPRLLPNSDFSPDMVSRFLSHHTEPDNMANTTAKPDTVDRIEFIGWSTALPGLKFPVTEVKNIVSPNTEHYSLVSFDVLKDGLAGNIRVVEQNPENNSPRSIAYNAIWSAQFRPRLKDGKAVSVSGIKARYYLPDTK